MSDDTLLVSIACIIATSLAHLQYLGSVLPRVWLRQVLSIRVSNDVYNLLMVIWHERCFGKRFIGTPNRW